LYQWFRYIVTLVVLVAETEVSRKTADLPKVTGKLRKYKMQLYRVHLTLAGEQYAYPV
jgi:hypothetical protein